MGQVADPQRPNAHGRNADNARWPHRQDLINRQFMQRAEDQPQCKTFAAGIDFMRRNAQEDSWFCRLRRLTRTNPSLPSGHTKTSIATRSGIGVGRYLTGRAMALSESDELVQQCRPTMLRWSACATRRWATCSTRWTGWNYGTIQCSWYGLTTGSCSRARSVEPRCTYLGIRKRPIRHFRVGPSFAR